MVVQWSLDSALPMQSGTDSIPGWGPKILHALQHGLNEWILKNKKKKGKHTGDFTDRRGSDMTKEIELGEV